MCREQYIHDAYAQQHKLRTRDQKRDLRCTTIQLVYGGVGKIKTKEKLR